MVNFQIRTINSHSINVSALILPKLTDFLPTRTSECKRSLQSQFPKLAGPDFMKSGKVDIILGSDVHELVVVDGTHEESNMHLRNYFWMDSFWKHR